MRVYVREEGGGREMDRMTDYLLSVFYMTVFLTVAYEKEG